MVPQKGEYQHGYNQQYQQPYAAQTVYATAPPADAQEVVAQPYTSPRASEVHVVGVAVLTQPHELQGPQRFEEVVEAPSSHCCLSWFACLVCFCPIGLFAVFMSMAVTDRMSKRDFEGAHRASDTARKAALAAIFIGAFIQIISYVYELQAISGSDDDTGNSPSPSPRSPPN